MSWMSWMCACVHRFCRFVATSKTDGDSHSVNWSHGIVGSSVTQFGLRPWGDSGGRPRAAIILQYSISAIECIHNANVNTLIANDACTWCTHAIEVHIWVQPDMQCFAECNVVGTTDEHRITISWPEEGQRRDGSHVTSQILSNLTSNTNDTNCWPLDCGLDHGGQSWPQECQEWSEPLIVSTKSCQLMSAWYCFRDTAHCMHMNIHKYTV
jgi:hypothetical protein